MQAPLDAFDHIMPREIVSHTAEKYHRIVDVQEWVDTYYIPDNYTSNRMAVYEQTGKRNNEDYTYRVSRTGDRYREARIQSSNRENVLLLGVPKLSDMRSDWLKLHDDERFCSARTGIKSEPSWCHCVHADYSRAGDFMFSATRHGEDFEMQLGVAISVLETMRYYSERESEVKALSTRIFDMPQVSDSMQKYIACIVLDKEYSPDDLKIMVQTSIVRNRKWNADDLSSTAALLILLPLVGRLFRNTRGQSSSCRQSAVPQVHEEFKAILASLNMCAKYHASPADTCDDGWTTVGKAKACACTINPEWIGTACGLAISFGVPQALVQSMRRELQEENTSPITTGKLVVKFILPSDTVSWIRNTPVDTRVVRVENGVRVVGLNSHTRCKLTLCPDTRAASRSFRVDPMPHILGCGTVSVSSGGKRRAAQSLLTTLPIMVEMDLRSNECVIQQGNIEFSVQCNRLNICFSGGMLAVTPTFMRNDTAAKICAARDVCCICLMDTEPSQVKYTTDCHHTYHKSCMNKWIEHCTDHPTCPMCRASI